MAKTLSPTEMIARELEHFLEDKEPGVVCIRGRWGVGKTHTWNMALNAVKASKKLGLQVYSPVSLFGITNLEQLKYAIFMNKQEGTSIGSPLGSSWNETLDKGLRAALDTLTGKGATETIQAAAFASIKDQIVCIDDIERKGKDLRTMDVLGLVSLLREHRGCKVVLILNDERLEEEKAELAKYQEKVIDASFLYAPTPEECANIALKKNTEFGQPLIEWCVRLQICNIRVIRKIEAAIRKVHPTLKQLDPQIFQNAVKSIALFGWAHYSEHEPVENNDPPPRNLNQELIQYITTKHGKGLYGSTRQSVSSEEERWDATLRAYDFGSIDELDADLCEGVLNGYFDDHKLKASANVVAARLTHADVSTQWRAAWDTFHGSFDDNEEEVVATFLAAFAEWCKFCNVGDLFTLMRILKQLGKNAQAEQALQIFMSVHDNEDAAFFELDQHMFGQQIDDPDLRKAFAEKAVSLRKTPKPRDILIRIYKNGGWHQSDLEILANMSVDELYDLFKRSSGEDHRHLITSALQVLNPSVVEKAKLALKRIGGETQLNRARVTAFGVQLPADNLNPNGGTQQ